MKLKRLKIKGLCAFCRRRKTGGVWLDALEMFVCARCRTLVEQVGYLLGA